MNEGLKIMITDCLNNSSNLTSAEIEFVQNLDESMKWPEIKCYERLKTIWRDKALKVA